jgi:hypothetical protein
MTKKIIIIILFSLMVISCGKKGCPKSIGDETDKCDELFK